MDADEKSRDKNNIHIENKSDKLDSETEEYSVENILRYKWESQRHKFLVKWKGYADSTNTWEPITHLENCMDTLVNFLSNYFDWDRLTSLMEKVGAFNLPTFNKIESSIFHCTWNVDYKLKLQKRVLTLQVAVDMKRQVPTLQKQALVIYWMLIKREKQMKSLEMWEKDINTIIGKLGEAYIQIENKVDFEGPPSNFVYVNKYIAGPNIVIPEEPPIGCSCEECGPKRKGCCGKETQFAYSKTGRIIVKLGTPIYECNKMCKCDLNCRNRVVQKLRKVPLSIFRTANGCGWGVKTLQNIPIGQYICQYVGEVITYEEAEARGKKYDKIGQTYLFDLDFNSNDEPYAVDATRYGNVSHFINHSCDPNLGVWSVWIDCLDPNIPMLALFALTYIKKGTELTFDYMASKVNDKKNNIVKDLKKKTECRCNAEKCRKYLF